MSEAIREARPGLRPGDAVLAGALSALGVLLMVFNLRTTPAEVAAAIAEGSMVHSIANRSWPAVPVFLLTTVPVLWWRRDLLAVSAVSVLGMGVHVAAFGWLTRCGAGLPLALVLAYLAGSRERGRRLWGVLGLLVVLTVLVLVRDSTTGLEPLVLAVPLLLVLALVGRAVRRRTEMVEELRSRTAELVRLRDERSALVVADDRSRVSDELDGMLHERLAGLAAAAEAGPGLGTDEARELLASLEAEGRRTLDDMREVLGRLRGGEVALAPLPAMSHLEALLAHRAGTTLTVTGDPTGLTPTVELSVFRIVEHLVDALSERPESRVEVTVGMADSGLEVRVEGRGSRGPRTRAAIARARERARLVGGSLELTVDRGRALAVAALPLPDRG